MGHATTPPTVTYTHQRDNPAGSEYIDTRDYKQCDPTSKATLGDVDAFPQTRPQLDTPFRTQHTQNCVLNITILRPYYIFCSQEPTTRIPI
jgi:hypothetical protein